MTLKLSLLSNSFFTRPTRYLHAVQESLLKNFGTPLKKEAVLVVEEVLQVVALEKMVELENKEANEEEFKEEEFKGKDGSFRVSL